MTNLNKRSSVHPRWTRWARSALSGFEVCTIQILDPNTADYGQDFSVLQNTASGTPTVLWTGTGQLQQFRSTLNAFGPVGSVTQVQSIRFTCDLQGPMMPIRKGFWIKVLDCPTNPGLEHYQYTVTGGLEAALAFGRDIEAEADMGVIS